MKKNIFYLVIISLLIYINVFFFVTAPNIGKQNEISYIEKNLEKIISQDVEFVNQFNLNEPIYFFKSQTTIYATNSNGKLITSNDQLDNNKRYAFYQEQIVYLVVENNIEQWISPTDGEILFQKEIY